MGESRTTYTQDMADDICSEISIGKSLRDICLPSDMPSRKTIYTWMDENDSFLNQYTRARKEQADFYAQEIVDIADTEEDPQRAKIRIDARKWVASKLKGSLYGDKQSIDHTTAGKEIKPAQQATTEQLEALIASHIKK